MSATRNLFVAGLPTTANDAALEALFSEHGQVVSAKVMVDLHTGKSRGFGFVLFADVESAAKAKAALNGLTVRADAVQPPLPHGYKLTVDFSNAHSADHVTAATDAIYVRNIPAGTPRDLVSKHFATFGVVRKIELMPDTAPGASSKFIVARITFDSMDAAVAAEKGTQCAANVFSSTSAHDNLPPLLAKLAERPSDRARRRHVVHETQKQLEESRPVQQPHSQPQQPQQPQQRSPLLYPLEAAHPNTMPSIRIGGTPSVGSANPVHVVMPQRVPSPPNVPSLHDARMGMGSLMPPPTPMAVHLLQMPTPMLSLDDPSFAGQVFHLTPVTYFRGSPDVDTPFARSRASSNASANLTPMSLGLMDSQPTNPFAASFSSGFASTPALPAAPPLTLYLMPLANPPVGLTGLFAE